MNGVTIRWNEGVPSDTSLLGAGDEELRSTKTDIRTGLNDEHIWPSGGGAGTGAHRKGSYRAFFAAQSAVSSSGTGGRMMIASDTSRLFGVGSEATVLLGSYGVLSAGSIAGITQPQRHYLAVEFSASSITSFSSASGIAERLVTFPNSGFSGVPFVLVTPTSFAGGAFEYSKDSITSTGFYAIVKGTGAGFGGTFNWLSIGTRVL